MRARRRGFTVLELAIGLAVLAILAALALPNFGGRVQRQRAQSAAEGLVADIAEARFEAARRGSPLFVTATPGPDWCWNVATQADCACGAPQACQLRATRGSAQGGVRMTAGLALRMDAIGSAGVAQAAELETARGDRLRVEVSALGRGRVCAVSGTFPRVAPC